jgi:uncharacterized membrane protein YkgB
LPQSVAQAAQSATPTASSELKTDVVSSLKIAEKSAGSRGSLVLLRRALVVIFLWFGGMKFSSYEANAIAPFIADSPIMSWLHVMFGVQGASYVIGIIDLSTAVALIVGAFNPVASALGAAMSCLTYIITLSFFLSTPGVAEAGCARISGHLGANRAVPAQGSGAPRSFSLPAAGVGTIGLERSRQGIVPV